MHRMFYSYNPHLLEGGLLPPITCGIAQQATGQEYMDNLNNKALFTKCFHAAVTGHTPPPKKSLKSPNHRPKINPDQNQKWLPRRNLHMPKPYTSLA